MNRRVVLALIIILIVSLLYLVFNPINQKIPWFAPGYFSSERIKLTPLEESSIFFDNQFKPKIIIDGQHYSGDGYSISKVSENPNVLVLTENQRSALFQFPQSQNPNLPQVYKQNEYLIVLSDVKKATTKGGGDVVDFFVHDKINKTVKSFSITLASSGKNSYSFDWFDQKVGNAYSMPGSVFSIHESNLFLPLEDLSDDRNPPVVYVYNIQSGELSKLNPHGNYCNQINITIKDGELFSKEKYFRSVWLSFSEPPSFLQPKCFTYKVKL